MKSKVLGIGASALALALSVVPAFAVTTPVDYTTSLDSLHGDMTGIVTTAGIPMLGVLVVMLGFGLVWRLLKKAAKSV